MRYPGNMPESLARAIFGDGVVDAINAGNQNPTTGGEIKHYVVWREERGGKLTKMGTFGRKPAKRRAK